MQKTNAMRMLDKAGITYEVVEYEVDENDLSGVSTAHKIQHSPEELFKTLVLKKTNKELIVCCIPAHEELDLKKVAKLCNSKNVEMLHMKELLPACGYIRGACSPIGMKKVFPTFIDETALLWDNVFVSAGMRGAMLHLASADLLAYTKAVVGDLCK